MTDAFDIADAVAAQIAAAAAGGLFGEHDVEPVVAAVPGYDVKDLVGLKVSVVPAVLELASESRADTRHSWEIHVGVQQKIEGDDDDLLAAVRELVALTQSIGQHMTRRNLESIPGVRWTKTTLSPLYDVEHLRQFRAFTGLVVLQYTAVSSG